MYTNHVLTSKDKKGLVSSMVKNIRMPAFQGIMELGSALVDKIIDDQFPEIKKHIGTDTEYLLPEPTNFIQLKFESEEIGEVVNFFISEKRHVPSVMSMTVVGDSLVSSDPLLKDILDFNREDKFLREELTKSLSHTISKVSTVQGLVKNWPNLLKYIPRDHPKFVEVFEQTDFMDKLVAGEIFLEIEEDSVDSTQS